MQDDVSSSQKPQRMRPWLEDLLDSGQTGGMEWLNKHEGTFRVSWKHGSRSGYNAAKDASVFELWAKHTGRYCPGKEEPNPKKWKANFRCALNSLSDVKPVKEEGKSKGNDAFRVFQFTQKLAKRKRVNASAKQRLNSCFDEEYLPPSKKRRCSRRLRSKASVDSQDNSREVHEQKSESRIEAADSTVVNIVPADETPEDRLQTQNITHYNPESGTMTGCLRNHCSGYRVTVGVPNEITKVQEVNPATLENVMQVPEDQEILLDASAIISFESPTGVEDDESCTSSSSAGGYPLSEEDSQPSFDQSQIPKPVIDIVSGFINNLQEHLSSRNTQTS